jgi:ribosome-binding protein aMBF1 (putative translation factor)
MFVLVNVFLFFLLTFVLSDCKIILITRISTKEKLSMNIGFIIKKLRERQRLSQETLAKSINISQSRLDIMSEVSAYPTQT